MLVDIVKILDIDDLYYEVYLRRSNMFFLSADSSL